MSDPLVLGGASWNTMIFLDRFPEARPQTISNARSRSTAGSTGLGKALALKALGHDPLLHATIGDDHEGRLIRAFTASRGLHTRLDIDPAGTSRHVNLMNAEGERISIFLSNGSPAPPVDAGALALPIAGARTIFLNITQSSVPLLPAVHASAADVWVDLHDYDGRNPWHDQFIAEADVIQLSDQAVADWRGVLERLGRQARLVILTRGRHGAIALAAGRWIDVPPVAASLVDSNGAGDAFMVATWHALSRGDTMVEALAFAAATASLVVESEELAPIRLDEADIRARMRTPT